MRVEAREYDKNGKGYETETLRMTRSDPSDKMMMMRFLWYSLFALKCVKAKCKMIGSLSLCKVLPELVGQRSI